MKDFASSLAHPLESPRRFSPEGLRLSARKGPNRKNSSDRFDAALILPFLWASKGKKKKPTNPDTETGLAHKPYPDSVSSSFSILHFTGMAYKTLTVIYSRFFPISISGFFTFQYYKVLRWGYDSFDFVFFPLFSSNCWYWCVLFFVFSTILLVSLAVSECACWRDLSCLFVFIVCYCIHLGVFFSIGFGIFAIPSLCLLQFGYEIRLLEKWGVSFSLYSVCPTCVLGVVFYLIRVLGLGCFWKEAQGSREHELGLCADGFYFLNLWADIIFSRLSPVVSVFRISLS